VYPNPSNSTVYIEEAFAEKVTIFNSVGQIIKVVSATEPIITVDVSNFVAGNYVFQISYLDGSTGTAKVVVK
jgi:hypothetical protein